MKKVLSLVLALMLVLPLAGTATAYWNDDWLPSGDWLGYTGEVTVHFTHEYSCTLRDYIADDFQSIKDQIESVKNYTTSPFETVDEMQNRSDFRRKVTVTLKDKSEESIRSTVYYLDSLPYVYETFAVSSIIREGDVNCDRIVNLNDVSHLLKYIAGWDNAPIEFHRTGDMDLDGDITIKDAAILLQVIAGWEMYDGIYEAGRY